MKILNILIVTSILFLLGACSSSQDTERSEAAAETADQASSHLLSGYERALDKAEQVEDDLLERARQQREALEEAMEGESS